MQVFYLINVVNREGIVPIVVIVVGRRVVVLSDHVGVCEGGAGDAYYEHQSSRR